MLIILAVGRLEAGRAGVQDHPQVQNQTEDNLGYIRIYLLKTVDEIDTQMGT